MTQNEAFRAKYLRKTARFSAEAEYAKICQFWSAYRSDIWNFWATFCWRGEPNHFLSNAGKIVLFWRNVVAFGVENGQFKKFGKTEIGFFCGFTPSFCSKKGEIRESDSGALKLKIVVVISRKFGPFSMEHFGWFFRNRSSWWFLQNATRILRDFLSADPRGKFRKTRLASLFNLVGASPRPRGLPILFRPPRGGGC